MTSVTYCHGFTNGKLIFSAAATAAASSASASARRAAFGSFKISPTLQSSRAESALMAAFATSLPHRWGRMSYTTDARRPLEVSRSATMRDVVGAADVDPIIVL